MTFNTKAEAKRFVAKLKKRGCFTQPIEASEVPWNKSIDDGGLSDSNIDWPSIKETVQQVLEMAKKAEAFFCDAAADDGRSVEDFLAVTITLLIQEVIEGD